MSWFAYCMLLLACSLPMFSLIAGQRAGTGHTPADDAFRAGSSLGLWVIPLGVMLALFLVSRVRLVRGKWRTFDQAVLFCAIGFSALVLLVQYGVMLFALVPVILVAMNYGRMAGITVAAFICLVVTGYVYRSEALGFAEMFFASMIILLSTAYLIGGMCEMNRKLIGVLTAERAALKNLVDGLPVGVCTVDSASEITYCNPRIGQIESRLCASLISDCGGKWEKRWPHLLGGIFIDMEFEGQYYRVGCSRLSEDEESTVIVIENESEKRALEAEIGRASYLAAVGEMAAGVAHEIRNPLAVISGYTQLLREKEDSATLAEVRPYLDVLQNEIRQMSRIVDNFVNLAEPRDVVQVSIGLSDLVNEVREFIFSEAQRLEVTLSTDLTSHLPKIQGDPSRLRQVLLNLVGNAFQSVGPGGTVVVRTFGDGQKVCLEVEDDGPGIPDGLQEKIFAPFFTTRDNGTGTGLAISRRVILDHGGTLTCSSRVGKTVFTVRLPLVRHAQRRSQAASM